MDRKNVYDTRLAKWVEHNIVRFAVYILRPFQMSKLIELFYAANWLWISFLSLLPEELVAGSVLNSLRQAMPTWAASTLLIFFSISSFYGLMTDKTWIRKTVLMVNLAIILLLFSRIAFNIPISSGAGFLAILAGLTILSYWKMDIGTDIL